MGYGRQRSASGRSTEVQRQQRQQRRIKPKNSLN
jgi:hypothetical protein